MIRTLPALLLAAATMLAGAAADPPAAATEGAGTPAQEQVPELSAVVTTEFGVFSFRLHAREAPLTVTNFCNLAKRGYFDGTQVFGNNRVAKYMGRFKENGTPQYTFKREFSPRIKFDGPGTVAMMKASELPNAGNHSTEWFVTIKNQERWHLDFTAFGTITEGQPVVNQLQRGSLIRSVKIVGDPSPLFAKYADRLAAWNAAIDATGWKPGDVPPPLPPSKAGPPLLPPGSGAPSHPPAAPPHEEQPPASPPPAATPPATAPSGTQGASGNRAPAAAVRGPQA